jgi:hypothetical protein
MYKCSVEEEDMTAYASITVRLLEEPAEDNLNLRNVPFSR